MAIKYIDMELGRNKPTLTTAFAYNPTGTVTRIFGNGIEHGLTTGEQVILSGFTAWLNGTWTITVVDAYSFNVNGAVWQATADFTGASQPVTPNGNDGSSWALATKGEITVNANDVVYVAKTPDPVSLGQNVTFTNKNKNIVLTTPVTLDVDQANVNNWTAVAPNTVALVTTASYKKLGNGVVQIAKGAAFTAPGKMAYRTLPAPLNLSGYTKLSFYFGASNVSQAFMCGLKICLCSDAVGNIVVNEFDIPALTDQNIMTAMVVTNGMALGNNINSIAIYMSNTYNGTPQLRFNHIFACNDVTLHSLISKTNTIFSEQFAIQSITGTTIVIDEGIFASVRGYYGTTETVNAYIRQVVNTNRGSILATALTPVSFLFGVNKATDLQDGETWLRNASFSTTGAVNHDLIHEISNVGFVSCSSGVSFNYGKMKNLQVTASYSQYAINLNGLYNCENIRANNNTSNLSTEGYSIRIRDCNLFTENKNIYCNNNTAQYIMALKIETCDAYFDNVQCCNNSDFGIVFTTPAYYDTSANYGQNNFFINVTALENGLSDIVTFCADNTFVNLSVSTTRIRAKTFVRNSPLITGNYAYNLYQANVGSVPAANRVGLSFGSITLNMGYAEWQTVEKQGNDPGAWKCYNNQAFLKLAEIAVIKDVPITIKVWLSNRINSELKSKLIIRKRKCPDIVAQDISTLIPEYGITWSESSLTFVPLETGIITLELYTDSINSPVYVGSITLL